MNVVSEKTTLDRNSGKLISTLQLTLKNVGDRPISPPLHLAVGFDGAGDLSTVSLDSGLGALGQPPYQRAYLDLLSQISGGLGAGQSVAFALTFRRPAAVHVRYSFEAFGVFNRDPLAVAQVPAVMAVGETQNFDGTGSSDPEGGALTYLWDFGDGTTSTTALSSHAYAAAGLYEARLTVTDPAGAQGHVTHTISVLPATPFSLARTRTLDDVGLPLGAVQISESGPSGPAQNRSSDPESGFASLGQGTGLHTWKFSRTGYLDVWRQATLSQRTVSVLPDPWLQKTNALRVTLSPIQGATVASDDGTVSVEFAPGAFTQAGSAAVTVLGTQSLPFPLPRGWSPVSAFHLDLPETPAEPGQATLQVGAELPSGTMLARLDESALQWIALAPAAATAVIEDAGSYVLVTPDPAPNAPGAPAIGSPLPAAAAIPVNVAAVTASGIVNPAVLPASSDPTRVTTEASVTFTNPAFISSGAVFHAAVEETYHLRDSRTLRTPDYDTTLFAYQQAADANPATLLGQFPLRPQLLFGSQDLADASVKVDVLAPSLFSGTVLDADGGSLGADGMRITVPSGALTDLTVAELRPLRLASYAGVFSSGPVIKAVELNVANLEPDAVFETSFEALEPNAKYVLARLVIGGGEYGLAPVARFRSDAAGLLTSNEPTTGKRLSGIRGPGQYLLLKVAAELQLVTGTVSGTGGAPGAGQSVRIEDQPWVAVADNNGNFFLLAPAGPAQLIAFDPVTGNEGQITIDVSPPDDVENADLSTVPTGPKVAHITPADGATNVPTVTPVTVRFSKPIDPATLAESGVVLRDTADSTVPASLSLNITNTTATLLPTNPLTAGASYTVEVALTITDQTNLPLEGANVFTFTVAKDTRDRIARSLSSTNLARRTYQRRCSRNWSATLPATHQE